ncbi:MAG: hypothetical protein Q7S66_01540 [bacterium]|nr:hypothetical protein [bacterium]
MGTGNPQTLTDEKYKKLVETLDTVQGLLASLKAEGVILKEDILIAIDAEKQRVVKNYIKNLQS